MLENTNNINNQNNSIMIPAEIFEMAQTMEYDEIVAALSKKYRIENGCLIFAVPDDGPGTIVRL